MGLSMPLFMRALEAEASTAGKVVVVVELNGGNDFFNTIVPLSSTQNGYYNDLRSNIALSDADLAATAFAETPAVAASLSDPYAFHPRMTALRQVYGLGNLAVILGIGIPPTAYGNTDHEQARFAWSSGTINSFDVTETGWVGSAFDQIGQSGGNLPAMIALNNSLPIIMRAKKGSPLVINNNIQYFSPNTGSSGSDSTTRLNGLNANDNYALASVPAEFARATAGETEEYVSSIQSIYQQNPLNNYSTTYAFTPGSPATYSGVKTQLQQVARVLLSGSQSRAFWVSQGGYDTHSDQLNNQAPLLGEFSEGVSQFWQYMQQANPTIASNLIIMTISDFGRRPNSNSTAGTDHGTGTVSFMLGGSVLGGVYGQYPSLAPSALDGNGNIAVPVDFRNHISDVCVQLGADPTSIVGQTYPSLGMFA
jgi:uncharacterized protein (DUF1501 family)